ncbi:MAG: carboxylate--amine ligase [Candidatus Binataceae bacterium]|nr:carboxylate--amine ligase [Candidatus Binataceae bacterium]
MSEDYSIPAVVLVCHRQVGIGITRSLGRLGVPVYGVDADRFSPALFSKYCAGKLLWDLHRAPVEQSIDMLLKLGRKIGRRSVLIPTSDVATMFVAEQAQILREHFIFPERDAGLISSLCSKKEMFRLARKWNVHTPETAFPQSRADVLKFLESARFPVLIKPIYNRAPAPGLRPWRMMLVQTKQELLDIHAAIEDPLTPNVMLQEYIPGGDEMTWTFNGYFDSQSECTLAFTGRKLRNFPPYFGQASLAICTGNDHVKNETIRFMKALGYTGPLDIGYRYDARDGRYKVNDINPRIGAMFRLFVGQAGMDVARAIYRDLTGKTVVAEVNPEGRKWIVEDGDLFSALRYYRDGNLTVRGWIDSLRGVQETAFAASDDMWPLVGACLMDGRKAVADGLATIRAKFTVKFPAATIREVNERATDTAIAKRQASQS